MGSTLLLLAVLGGLQVEVNLQDGTTRSGQLQQLNSDRLEVLVDNQAQTWQRSAVRRLDFSPSPQDQTPAAWVEMTGGTQLFASALRVNDDQMSLTLSGDMTVQLPREVVRRVRLRGPDPARDAQWKEILEKRLAADILVVHRPNDAIDYLEGVLGDVSDATVQFQFDGDWVDVAREKMDGWVYYHPAGKSYPAAICQLTTIDGSRWHVASCQLAEDRLQLETVEGIQVTLPANQLQRLDYASSSTVFLSDLDPETVSWSSFVGLNESLSEILQELFRPRRDSSIRGKPLQLRFGAPESELRQFQRGWAIHSRTELVFRLAGEYRQFQAIAGIDPDLDQPGRVQLVVRGDDRVLFQAEIAGHQPPVPIDVDVSAVKRLTILVDYGDATDFADHLNLCDARLMK